MIKKSIKQIAIVPEEECYYPGDDIPEQIEKYIKRNQKKPIKRRNDLSKGMVVVVLEGAFIGKRVVFLKKLEDNFALCIGPRSINGIPMFKINERYLLATSTVLDFGASVHVDESKVTVSDRDVEIEVREETEEEKVIDADILKAAEKIQFMKAYLSSNFKVDASIDFYSRNY